MGEGRLEAFSDGVLAIIITIMVLELKVPSGDTLSALLPLMPVLGSYVLSFVYVATYWNNHHHLFLVTERVSGGVLWANMGLLFCLSLIPFGTALLRRDRTVLDDKRRPMEFAVVHYRCDRFTLTLNLREA
jgi:uncharacterized membrane protein